MKSILIYIALGLGLTTIVQAGDTLLEPYVGLTKTQVKMNSTGYYDVADGFFLGVKLGHFFGNKYFVAGDYHQGGPYNFGPLLSNAQWNHAMYGLGLGINYTFVRYWLGYYINNTYTDRTFGVQYTGTGAKVGIGFQIHGNLRCNLDLVYSFINKEQLSGSQVDFSGYNISSAHVSISIPLDL